MTTPLNVLNRASIHRHFDAYTDVPWDDPDYALDPCDPRLALPEDDPLGGTEWYRSLPQDRQARLGLQITCEMLHIGMDFEGVLSAGLLELSRCLDVGDPMRRYALHEVIEEGQHTLMFREIIMRSGLPTRGLRGVNRLHSYTVPRQARRFPEYFFFFVLGGEAPVDRAQRAALRRREALHPLLEKVFRIHVTEEARHISFADLYLREHVPELSAMKRAFLSIRVPIIMGEMSEQMLVPPAWIRRAYEIPDAVMREAYRGPRHHARLVDGVAKVRRLSEELGLTGPFSDLLWRHWRIAPLSSPLTLPPARG